MMKLRIPNQTSLTVIPESSAARLLESSTRLPKLDSNLPAAGWNDG
jgi:hypothetical protein